MNSYLQKKKSYLINLDSEKDQEREEKYYEKESEF